MKIISKLIKWYQNLLLNTKGQALIIVVLALTVLLGFGALTVDAGYLYVQRRSAQNIADAAALAGTWKLQELVKIDGVIDIKPVVDEVKKYALQNGVEETAIKEVNVRGGRYVEVDVEKEHKLFLASVIGIKSAKITATATATRNSIWGPNYKDVLPLGIISWEEIFYEPTRDEAEGDKDNDYYDLFKNNKNINYDLFKNRNGILKESVRKYLIKNNNLNQIIFEGNPYPSSLVENLLKDDLNIYMGALQELINVKDESIINFKLLLGSLGSITGNYDFVYLDGTNGTPIEKAEGWIDNGYVDNLGTIETITGGKVPIIDNLSNYLDNRGKEAYVLAILPRTIGTGSNWPVNQDEYLILHVKNLVLNPKDGDAQLTGTVVEVFKNLPIIKPGETNSEYLPQSWLVN